MENEYNKAAILNVIDVQNCQFNYDKIRENYEFYLIKNDDQKNKFKPESRILDDALITKNVLAIQYTGGPAFILMMKSDKRNEDWQAPWKNP